MTRDRVSGNDHAIARADIGERMQAAELEALRGEYRWRRGVIRQRVPRPERRCLMKCLHRTGEIQNLAAGEYGEDHSSRRLAHRLVPASGIGVRRSDSIFILLLQTCGQTRIDRKSVV